VSGCSGDTRLICVPSTFGDFHFTALWTENQTFGAGLTKIIFKHSFGLNRLLSLLKCEGKR